MTGPKRVSERQLAANRANAQRSTGPRTPEGRAASRYNALTHGILAGAVIPEALELYESREAFDALLAALHDDFAPATTLEELLVEQIAVTYWRLARLYRAEAGAIAGRRDAAPKDRARDAALHRLDPYSPLAAPDPLAERMEQLDRARSNRARLRAAVCEADPSLADAPDEAIGAAAQREMDRLLGQLGEREVSQEAHRDAVDNAARSMPALEAMTVYSRYEATLQRLLHRSLDTLERLQRQRAGEHVPPPARLDVDVDLVTSPGSEVE